MPRNSATYLSPISSGVYRPRGEYQSNVDRHSDTRAMRVIERSSKSNSPEALPAATLLTASEDPDRVSLDMRPIDRDEIVARAIPDRCTRELFFQ